MATQQTHFEIMLDRIEKQAKEIALFAHEKEEAYKRAEHFEQLAFDWEKIAATRGRETQHEHDCWELAVEHSQKLRRLLEAIINASTTEQVLIARTEAYNHLYGTSGQAQREEVAANGR